MKPVNELGQAAINAGFLQQKGKQWLVCQCDACLNAHRRYFNSVCSPPPPPQIAERVPFEQPS
jgi:hypothetical protein